MITSQVDELIDSDWQNAAQLLISVGEYRKAIQILGEHKALDKLIDVCRVLDKTDNSENIGQCAVYFRRFGHHQYAKEAFLKLGDLKALMNLHIELNKWDEAQMLAKQNPEFASMIHLPFAEYLEKNDRFEDAQKHFKKANRPDLSMRLIEKLSKNALFETRFKDACGYFWNLAVENLRLVKNARNPDNEDTKYLSRFQEFELLAEVYQAYGIVHHFLEEPFQNITESYTLNVFNAARFILGKLNTRSPVGV